MKYLTIAEFADRAGVTSQSVYQRIKRNGLEEYIVTSEDGVKRISEDALKLYSNSKKQESVAETACDAPQACESEENEGHECLNAETIKSLQETVEALRGIIDRQADELKQKTEMLDERDKQIADYASMFKPLCRHKRSMQSVNPTSLLMHLRTSPRTPQLVKKLRQTRMTLNQQTNPMLNKITSVS